jgi:hypothetical protein
MTSQVRLDVCLYIVKSQVSTDAPWLFLCWIKGKAFRENVERFGWLSVYSVQTVF